MDPGKDPDAGPTVTVPVVDPKYPTPQYGQPGGPYPTGYAPSPVGQGYGQGAPYNARVPYGGGPPIAGGPGYPAGAGGSRFYFPGSQDASGYAPLGGQAYGDWDPEAAQNAGYAAAFQNLAVRKAFVSKVLFIVFAQLAVTAAASAAFYYVHPLKSYVQSNVWPFWAAWGLSFAVLLVLSCSQSARRSYPTNIITLAVFTATFAFLVGVVTSFYSAQLVVAAFAITSAVVGFVFLLATSTSFDFTKQGGFLYIITFTFLAALVVGMFWISQTFIIVISIIGAILFAAYLLYDIQLLMGGHTLELSPDEYVFASINIYLDIINIFLNILQVLQATNSN
eukprot:jgi/Botrbrau1/10010/Bobra.0012s0098.2